MRQLDFTQISVLTAPYLHHTLEYALDSIAANGFHSVELWGASPHFCMDDYTPEERAASTPSTSRRPSPTCGSGASSSWSSIWRTRWIWAPTG